MSSTLENGTYDKLSWSCSERVGAKIGVRDHSAVTYDSLKKLQDVTQVMATPLNMFKFKFKFKFKFNSTASKVLILQLT